MTNYLKMKQQSYPMRLESKQLRPSLESHIIPYLGGEILHSDRGSQYTSESFCETLSKAGIDKV